MKLLRLGSLSTLLALFATSTLAKSLNTTLAWTLTPTNTTAQFRGLHPVSASTVWLSGTRGTVLRTTNAGSTWTNVSPKFPSENSSTIEFRDVHAWSETDAVILSIGEGNASRIYRTCDGGQNWTKTFVNQEAKAFYDCLAFEKEQGREGHGVAMSDPVDGRFRLLETWDGGATWKILATNATMPPALEGEFGFAASGTCIETAAGRWYVATGGVDPGRIFHTSNVHRTWKVSNSSIAGGAAAGVFSVRFRDEKHGIAVGGDYEKPAGNVNNAAWSSNGGQTWDKADTFPGGYRSGVSWVPGRKDTAVAVGTSGSDITFDSGRNWFTMDNGTFDTVECVKGGVCWASGSKGRVGRLLVPEGHLTKI